MDLESEGQDWRISIFPIKRNTHKEEMIQTGRPLIAIVQAVMLQQMWLKWYPSDNRLCSEFRDIHTAGACSSQRTFHNSMSLLCTCYKGRIKIQVSLSFFFLKQTLDFYQLFKWSYGFQKTKKKTVSWDLIHIL